MNYGIETAAKGKTIRCSGRLSFSDASAFHDIADQIRSEANLNWQLEFSQLEFIDSAGLGMLLMVRDLVSRGSGQISISGAAGQVRKALDLARFSELMTIEA